VARGVGPGPRAAAAVSACTPRTIAPALAPSPRGAASRGSITMGCHPVDIVAPGRRSADDADQGARSADQPAIYNPYTLNIAVQCGFVAEKPPWTRNRYSWMPIGALQPRCPSPQPSKPKTRGVVPTTYAYHSHSPWLPPPEARAPHNSPREPPTSSATFQGRRRSGSTRTHRAARAGGARGSRGAPARARRAPGIATQGAVAAAASAHAPGARGG
jgi:hypothetical protein